MRKVERARKMLIACRLQVLRGHLCSTDKCFFHEEEEGGVDEAGLAQRVLMGARGTCRIVLISGFESFNVALYEKVRAHKQ